jgi:hypothetical protein
MAKRKASEFDYVSSDVKVSGSAPAPDGRDQMEHGEEVYFLARGAVVEVSFPEDKEGNIKRVAKVRLEKGFVVEAEDAENIIAEQREKQTGQGNIIAEINRSKPKAEKAKATKAAKPAPVAVVEDDEDDEDDDDFEIEVD